ncbi:CTLH/CRA C-terminal to lish motif domain-containing protein [Polychytrium aggregatum]|uniref:CTLH/CRA C-terminal to lish motif domain-containing protein n=1 Tax=Polychytrium aggregatum TaxID=110093 RepID=UPI0022FF42FA|nr:CTLH/CRA C-terminal to lish motif domain-containing protein [Polychytrium aggregatum]KAI9206396.1 CTLH/CRA C-terminal to lish motif domain-containing protein [Polychytrium aggregatum]
MDSLVNDYQQLTKRQKRIRSEATQSIDSLISTLTATKSALQSQATPGSHVLPKQAQLLSQSAKSTAAQLSEQNKEFYSALGKFSKALDKKFKLDLDTVWDPRALDGPERYGMLNQTIANHFIREGQFAVLDTFLDESAMPRDGFDSFKEKFSEMFTILEDLKAKRSLDSAIRWAVAHSSELWRIGSHLEFSLCRLQFITLLLDQKPALALDYAKATFPKFTKGYMKEIQRLSCSVLFAKRLHNSPYADLLDPNHWTVIQQQFTRDFCQLLGLSSESPLYTAISVGTCALPAIIKMSSIVKERALEWTQQGELPVEIPLLDQHRFHSIFVCPVSKEQATPENPPMMLQCGHVLTKESLVRLTKGNLNAKFKCPYCPSESTISQATRIHF